MLAALALSLTVTPIWAFGGNLVVLAVGALLMQAGVQGAWGVIPVHLNELASDSARGLTSGLVYQCGILFAAPTSSIEYSLRDRIGYQWAITTFEIVTILTLSLLLWKGVEQHGRRFADLLPSGNENGVNKSAKFRTEATVVKL